MVTRLNIILLVVLFNLLAILPSKADTNIATSIKEFKVDGVKVLFKTASHLPMLDIALDLRAGTVYDQNFSKQNSQKLYGIANLTAILLDKNTKYNNQYQLVEKLDNLGSKYSFLINKDRTTFKLRSLVKKQVLTKSIALLTEIITAPKFQNSNFTIEKNIIKQELKQQQNSPSSIAQQTMWQNIFPEHGYGQNPLGTIQTLNNIKLKHIQQFYKQYYIKQNLSISMIGNVSLEQAKNIARSIIAGFAEGNKAKILPLSAFSRPKSSIKKLYNKFDSTQGHYYYGTRGITRTIPQYQNLFLMNHIIGGSGFGSLLMADLREKKGLTYGVYSYFIPLEVGGLWVINFSTKSNNLQLAHNRIKQILNNLDSLITTKLLKDNKANLIGGFPLRISSNNKMIGYLSMMNFYNLPLDYIDIFPKKINQVTLGLLKKTWRKIMQDRPAILSIVGSVDIKK